MHTKNNFEKLIYLSSFSATKEGILYPDIANKKYMQKTETKPRRPST